MSTRPGVQYLPQSLVQELLWTAFTPEQRAALDSDTRWRMARLVESAFQQGHHEGYMRAHQEASAARADEKPTPTPIPDGLMDAVQNLAGMTLPPDIADRWSGLAHAIDRVTRFAEEKIP